MKKKTVNYVLKEMKQVYNICVNVCLQAANQCPYSHLRGSTTFIQDTLELLEEMPPQY